MAYHTPYTTLRRQTTRLPHMAHPTFAAYARRVTRPLSCRVIDGGLTTREKPSRLLVAYQKPNTRHVTLVRTGQPAYTKRADEWDKEQ